MRKRNQIAQLVAEGDRLFRDRSATRSKGGGKQHLSLLVEGEKQLRDLRRARQ